MILYVVTAANNDRPILVTSDVSKVFPYVDSSQHWIYTIPGVFEGLPEVENNV